MEPEGIGTWIRRRAVKSRGHAAIIFRDREIEYQDLAQRIDALAAALRLRGIRQGDRVAYLGNNHPAFIESLFATALLGAIFVPLNTRLSAHELRYMLTDSGSAVLISAAALEAQAAEASADLPVRRLVLGDVDAPHPTDAQGAEDYEAAIAAAPALGEIPRTELGDRALIIYTSGTTGTPKGAVLTHGNVTWNAINVLADYDVSSSDRALMISPLFHVASLGMGCLPVLLKGATVLLEERFVPGDALRAIERLHATSISGVPTTYQMMVDDPAWADADISSLRLLTCGGSSVPARVRDAYRERGLAFSGGYGMTESSPGITLLPPWHAEAHDGSAGLPHFFTDVRIRRTDGALAEPGEPGEIEARGPNVFLEYWGNPEATAAAFTDDGWLLTGDVGIADADGFVTIVDRVKDMIISGGENVYTAEIELAIMAAEGVTGAAVIGLPHEKWGEVPHAIVTVAEGVVLDIGKLIDRLSARLGRYKVPRTVEVVDELPRTASGKVQKKILRDERLNK